MNPMTGPRTAARPGAARPGAARRRAPGHAHAWTVAHRNGEPYRAEVEATLTGPAGRNPSTAGVSRETIDRVRAAVINSGRRWPDGRLAITVWPPHPDTTGQSQLDLAVACAVLAATCQIPRRVLRRVALIAELALDGALRPPPGQLSPYLRVARAAGARTAVVPAAALREAATEGLTIVGAAHLTDIRKRLPHLLKQQSSTNFN